MFDMRQQYPVLNDGYYLQQLSNQTHDVYLPGSEGTPTETGIWSVLRSAWPGVQNLTSTGEVDESVWLLYSNEDRTVNYEFNCSDNASFLSPFAGGTTVKNLFPPYEEYTLEQGPSTLDGDGHPTLNGCVSLFSMPAWGFKALVPKEQFVKPRPTLTSFSPGHDYRLQWTHDDGGDVHLAFGYSTQMDCNSISKSIQVTSKVTGAQAANLNLDSVKCSTTNSTVRWVGEPATAFIYEVDLLNVHHGIHQITIGNVTSTDGDATNTVDSVLIRVGDFQNPMVFPSNANYSDSLLFTGVNGYAAFSLRFLSKAVYSRSRDITMHFYTFVTNSGQLLGVCTCHTTPRVPSSGVIHSTLELPIAIGPRTPAVTTPWLPKSGPVPRHSHGKANM